MTIDTMTAPATEAQVSYARALGITVAEGVSRAALSDAIDEAKLAFEEAVARAKRVPITEVINTTGMRRVGREYSSPCPFCGNRAGGATRDGFVLVPHKQAWVCRKCAPGYNSVIDFVMRRDGCDFPAAVRSLAHVPQQQLLPPRAAAHATDDEWEPPVWCAQHVRLLSTITRNPGRFRCWQAYKPLSRRTIRARELGIGVVPGQGICAHPRLLVPIFEMIDGYKQLVNMRGRAYVCDCPKWLTAGGGRTTLHGIHDIPSRATIFVVENHVDAMLLHEAFVPHWPRFHVLSPTSPGMRWQPRHLHALAEADPNQIILALDNDSAGREAGARVQQQLAEAGFATVTRMWDWPAEAPHKAGGDWIAARYKKEEATR